MRLTAEGAAAARPQQATQATSERVLVVAGQANPRSCSPRAAQPLHCWRQLETSEPSGPAAPAVPVPWQRAHRPLAPTPPERLKRQPPGHHALPALQGGPRPPRPLHPLSPKRRRAVAGEASGTSHRVLPPIIHTTLLPASSSKAFEHPPPQTSKDAKQCGLSPLQHQPA